MLLLTPHRFLAIPGVARQQIHSKGVLAVSEVAGQGHSLDIMTFSQLDTLDQAVVCMEERISVRDNSRDRSLENRPISLPA